MKRSLYLTAPLLALAVMAAACGGGDGGQPDATNTPETTATPAADVTPGVEVTPGAVATFTPSAGVSPIPGARPAVLLLPEEIVPFLDALGEVPTVVACGSYDADTGLVDCTEVGHGTFQLDPLVPAEVKECRVATLNDKVVFVSCVAELAAFIYKIGA